MVSMVRASGLGNSGPQSLVSFYRNVTVKRSIAPPVILKTVVNRDLEFVKVFVTITLHAQKTCRKAIAGTSNI